MGCTADRRSHRPFSLVAFSLLLLLAFPVMAYAASFTNQSPLGVVRAKPQVVTVTVFGSVALDTRTAKVTIDGVSQYVLSSTTSSGRWVYTESGPDADGRYTAKWVWVSEPRRQNQVVLNCYPTGAAVADGAHTVVASIKDKAGALSSDSWVYTVQIPPILGAPVPAAGSVVTTTSPAISVPVTDNGTGALTATATVNGAAAAAVVSGGSAQVTSPVLANDATATVAVTVTDSAGGKTTKTWSFFVQIYPDMAGATSDCVACHPVVDGHGPTEDCVSCHDGAPLPIPHPGSASSFHIKADVTACAPCHVSDITVEHARRDTDAGQALTCLTCHTSTDPAVVGAIASGNSACSACHADTSHGSLHDTTVSPSCAGADCHTGTNLVGIHINAGTTLGCESCHASADPDVVDAIETGDKDCTACHDSGGHYAVHDTAVTPTCAGAECHSGTNLTDIHINAQTALTCASCHASADPDVVDAIETGDKDCTACHSPTSPHGDDAATHQASPASEVIDISGISYGVHECSECHGTTNLLPVHSDVCATCHPTPKDSLAGGWSGGCVEGGCHTLTSTAPMHATIDDAHEIPAAIGPQCFTAGCHDAAGVAPFEGKSVAELHSSASTTTPGGTRTSCEICHNESVTPTANCLTAGCHADRSEPHGYDAATHTGTPTPSTFDINSVTYPAIACDSCHALELGVEHTKATSMGNTGCSECHATRVSQLPPPWNRATCAQGDCHTGTSLAPQHADIGIKHLRPTTPAVNACFAAGCHAEGDLAAVHSEATTNVAGQDRESCTVCHADGIPTTNDCTVCHADKIASHYDVATHTGAPTPSTFVIAGVTYPALACDSCHDVELAVEHAKTTSAGSGSGCAECHPARVDQLPPPWDKATCAQGDCHAGASVAPQHGTITSSHARLTTPAVNACFAAGCHTDGDLAAVHSEATTNVAGQDRESCMVCHADGIPATNDCTVCHADKVASHYNATQHTATVTSGNMTILGMDHGTHTCTECHSIELGVEHSLCSTCHPTPAASAKPWNGNCATADCHTVGTSAPMHSDIDTAHVRPAEPAAADNCFDSGCHAGGDCIADIHSSDQDCATCHGAGKTPTADCQTSGCHPDLINAHPGQQAIHTSTGGTDFVTAGMENDDHWLPNGITASCSDCHIMDLVVLHMNYCGACHSPAAPQNVKDAIANNITACTACHPSEHDGGNQAHEDIYVEGCDCHLDPYGDWTQVDCSGCHAPWTPVPNPVTTSDARAYYVNDATIQLFPTDGPYGVNGIKNTYYVLDGAAVATGTQIIIPAPPVGTEVHTLKFWSTDWSGNVEPTNTVTFTVEHDSYWPLTVSDITPGGAYAGNQTFTLTAHDEDSYVAGTWWQLDSTSPGGWTSGTSIPVAAPASGIAARTAYWYSIDGVGNIEPVKSAAFTIAAGKDFAYTGADQTWVVPSGLTTVAVTLNGGSGGDSISSTGTNNVGGKGGRVTAVIPVTAGQTLTIRVGRAGYPCSLFGSAGVGGWPTGGRGSSYGGGGGGSSSIWSGATELAEAGGGGGGGRSTAADGIGGSGGAAGTLPGGYRTPANGTLAGAGGGGGGWNAGAAGTAINRGGTGGTSRIASGTGSLTAGVASGNGSVTIRY